MRFDVPVSDSYRGPLRGALLWSVVITVISALMLDGGEFARLSLIAMLLFWGAVLVVIFRRPRNPTDGDLTLIRWGCLIVVMVLRVGTYFVWRWRGLA